ncbi:MAG: FecR domain-containing protein [Bacteroidetes bacterium]|nr:FecR domain-containing protein [Bacteroidota bacterium]
MEVTKSLIRKFFANECNEQERAAVLDYLSQHPEEAGWDEWVGTAAESFGPVLHQEEVLKELKGRLFPRPMWRTLWPAAAAAVLLLVGGWVFWGKSRPTGGSPAVAVSRPGPGWVYRTNEKDSVACIVLPDGSRVKLYAHSALRYAGSFGATGRDSWLVGEAEFDVKKDRLHPFSVHGVSLSTTALGTVFSVSTIGNETVKLLSGRVVVTGLNKDVYLMPGEEVNYDRRRMVAKIIRFGKPEQRDSRQIGVDDGTLAFNNSPLKEVFKKLTIRYNKKFDFRASDLSGLNFTGAVEGTDSLDVFLRLLGGMNSLDIVEEPGGYRVTRRGN